MFPLKLRVHLALLIVTLIYAAVFTIVKPVLAGYLKPEAFILLRVAVAGILFWCIRPFLVREKVERNDIYRLMLCGVFGVGANMLLFFAGLAETLPINGAVLMTNTPVFVVVVAALLKYEKLNAKKIAGILLASLGATLLIGGYNFNFSSNTVRGDLMIVANAIIYSFYLVYVRKLLIKYHPITVSGYTFLFGFLFVLPFGAMSFADTHWISFTPKVWYAVIFIVIGSTFVTYLLNAWALRNATSSLVGSYIYLQPVFAVLIAQLSGSDEITFEKIIYTLIIFLGVWLVNRKS